MSADHIGIMDIQFNTNCYRFMPFQNSNEYSRMNEKNVDDSPGLLDQIVDCTYIIHLEGNGRLPHIYAELAKTKPTKTIFIVFNPGFKKCEKKLIDQASYQDLTDAFLQCFKHARDNKYKNILILEDDFIFNPEIHSGSHIDCICRFLETRKNEEYVYHLGLIPVIAYPVDWTTYRSIKSFTMHSAIYSEKCIENSANYSFDYKHWDVIIEKNVKNRYFYYKPLCYQTFPATENRKTWENKDMTFFWKWVKNFAINHLKIDEKPEPGFSILYWVSKLLCFTLLLCFIYILYLFSKNLYRITLSTSRKK